MVKIRAGIHILRQHWLFGVLTFLLFLSLAIVFREYFVMSVLAALHRHILPRVIALLEVVVGEATVIRALLY